MLKRSCVEQARFAQHGRVRTVRREMECGSFLLKSQGGHASLFGFQKVEVLPSGTALMGWANV